MESHQIVRELIDKFPNWARRMANLADKSEELYRSHGRMPKTIDPLASGNKSPVTHYIQYCRQSEAATPGAGSCLNNRVHGLLTSEFAEADLIDTPPTELHHVAVDEFCDVNKILARTQLDNMSPSELRHIEAECAEAQDALNRIRARAIVLLRTKTMVREAA